MADAALSPAAVHPPSPERILQTGLGLWRAHALAAAIELGVFAELARGPRTAAQVQRRLRLEPAAATDFLDALVSLNLIEREGDDALAVYVNTREASHYLDPRSPAYLGELLRPGRQPMWGDAAALCVALRGDMPTSPAQSTAAWPAAATASHEVRDVREQLAALHGAALADAVEWGAPHRLLDVDGGAGRLSCALAAAQAPLECLSLVPADELPRTRSHIAALNLSARVHAAVLSVDDSVSGWPPANTVTLDLVLREPSDTQRVALLTRARAATAGAGRLIVIAHLLDPMRRHSAAALMLSLAQRMSGGAGLSLTVDTLESECRAVGFQHFVALPGATGASIVIASG